MIKFNINFNINNDIGSDTPPDDEVRVFTGTTGISETSDFPIKFELKLVANNSTKHELRNYIFEKAGVRNVSQMNKKLNLKKDRLRFYRDLLIELCANMDESDLSDEGIKIRKENENEV